MQKTAPAPVRRPPPTGLNNALRRNIAALRERRDSDVAHASRESKVADAITRFTGSLRFVYLHLALFGFWIATNLGWVPGITPWDPSFVVLAMAASVEAIFLSTFVLISQNRMAEAADKRAELDLQISLLAEHEITRLVEMVDAIAAHFGLPPVESDLEELKQDVAPEAVLDAINAQDAARE